MVASTEVVEAVVKRVVMVEVGVEATKETQLTSLMDRREFNLLMRQTRVRNKDFKVTIDSQP